MTEGVTIREFRYPEDYPQAARLWQSQTKGVRFGRSDVPEEIEKKVQRDPDLFLVAEAEGRLIATVIGAYDGRRGFVYHLVVAEAHRRRGIAEALMAELEKRLVAKGAIRVYLLVATDNLEARAFYEKNNWIWLDYDVIYAKDIA
jgi:ribosomal protein S18 acetylase RimI-like enzyme